MGKGKRAVFIAAILTLGSMGFAQDTTTPAAPAETTSSEGLLMSGLDAVGVGKPISDAGINIYGYVEGSYEYNFQKPPGHINTGRIFDTQSDNNAVLNQVDLTFERTVDYTKDKWDVGGRVEVIYGSDPRFFHSNGTDFYGPNDAADGGEQTAPGNQFDLNQAYVDIAVPIGTGLRIRIGKFNTLLGYETINPTTNPLFTHSFLFGYAIPFNQTGILGTYNLSDSITVNAGITRGWEQSLKDNNGDAIDFLGGVTWAATKKLTVIVNNSTGPEEAHDTDSYRTVWDLVMTYNATDAWTFGLNGDFGYEQNAAALGTDGNAYWYGLAGYAGYKINEYVTANGRAEWFNDQDDARGLDPIPGKGTEVWEGTLGVTLTPMPNDSIGKNLKIRPEVRYDYAQDPIFAGATENSQVTAAIEAYFTY